MRRRGRWRAVLLKITRAEAGRLGVVGIGLGWIYLYTISRNIEEERAGFKGI